MRLIGVKSRKTLRSYCRHLGYQGRVYCQQEIEQLYLMSRWLKAGYGSHSRAQFCRLRRQKQLREAFINLGINIDLELGQLHKNISHAYEQGTRNSVAS